MDNLKDTHAGLCPPGHLMPCRGCLTPPPLLLPLWIIFICPWVHNPFFQDSKSMIDLNWITSQPGEWEGRRQTWGLAPPVLTGPLLPTLRFPTIGSVLPCCANIYWQMTTRRNPCFGAIPFKSGCSNKAQMHWDTLPCTQFWCPHWFSEFV